MFSSFIRRVFVGGTVACVAMLGAALPEARAQTAAPSPGIAALASVSSPCSPTNCTGFYAGMNLTGIMTNANVVGNGINGSIAGGGQSIGGQVGYQFANGTWFFGPEFDFDWTVGGTAPAGGKAPTYLLGEYVKIGTALTNILGLSAPTTTGSPGVLSQLSNVVISPYLIFGAAERSWGTGWATGAGVEYSLSNNWFLDTRYTYINYANTAGSTSTLTTTSTATSENLVTVGINYKF